FRTTNQQLIPTRQTVAKTQPTQPQHITPRRNGGLRQIHADLGMLTHGLGGLLLTLPSLVESVLVHPAHLARRHLGRTLQPHRSDLWNPSLGGLLLALPLPTRQPPPGLLQRRLLAAPTGLGRAQGALGRLLVHGQSRPVARPAPAVPVHRPRP